MGKKGVIATVQKEFTVKSSSSEEFFITFLSGLNSITDLVRPSDVKVLALLCTKANPVNGIVELSVNARSTMTKSLDMTQQSFSNALLRLRQANLLEGERGDFEVHPQNFWRGSLEDRQVLLKDMSAELALNYRRV